MIEQEKSDAGIFKIKDKAIKSISVIAAKEVEGVVGTKGNVLTRIARFATRNDFPEGVKVAVKENEIKVTLAIVAKYGANLPAVAGNVQDRVKAEIEKMTGLNNIEVNVNIQDVVKEAR